MSKPVDAKYNSEQLRAVGLPAYLSQESPSEYQLQAVRNNIVLMNKFRAVYFEVFRVLASYFDEEIYTTIKAAVPGFHVIRVNDKEPSYHGGVPHVDSSYLHIPAFVDCTASTDHYSFTILLSEMDGDIGLEYWKGVITESDASKKCPDIFLKYRRGVMVLFGSNLVHRIAPFKSKVDRVTLQGHLIRFKGKLLAYW